MAIPSLPPSPVQPARPAALRCSLPIQRPHDLHPKAYALQVVGDCLAPVFTNGDYAIVEPVMPAPGDLAAVYLVDEDLPLIKHVTSFNPRWLNAGPDRVFVHQIALGQTNPHRVFLIRSDKVDKIHRVRGNYASFAA